MLNIFQPSRAHASLTISRKVYSNEKDWLYNTCREQYISVCVWDIDVAHLFVPVSRNKCRSCLSKVHAV